MKRTSMNKTQQESQSKLEQVVVDLQHQLDEAVAEKDRLRNEELKLVRLAYYDALTGLPNKNALLEHIHGDALQLSDKYALLYIDLDDFKYINNTTGHLFGDQLISQAGKRLESLITEGCSIYSFGGDEFVIIVNNLDQTLDAEIYASHIVASLKEKFQIKGTIAHIRASIGIAMYPDHGKDVEELIQYADMAMGKAKEYGRNTYVVYDQQLNEAIAERLKMESLLDTALTNSEFTIYYQPQVELSTGRITGLEALLRWKSPELGFVSPLKFIKAAEDTRFILPLGAWVLRKACIYLKRLHDIGYTELSMSVNISVLQLLQTDFVDMVTDIFEYIDLDPSFLELEITESILMQSYNTIYAQLIRLKEMGIRIALDDFGKGYSSLSYLKQLPISTLKIDKLFVDDIDMKSESQTITGEIVVLGKKLGMHIVAEGVERKEQIEYLKMYECDTIQGYICSRPVPEQQLEALLRQGKTGDGSMSSFSEDTGKQYSCFPLHTEEQIG